MTTTSPTYYGVACNGCATEYEDWNGWTVSTAGTIWESAADSGWIETADDQHWCEGCQREGKVPDDGGHKAAGEGDEQACVKCDEEWPCPPYELMHSRDVPSVSGTGETP